MNAKGSGGYLDYYCIGLDYFFMAADIIPEPHPGCTCSVHSSLRSTSTRRKYGEDTEQVRYRYDAGVFLMQRRGIVSQE